MKHEKTLMQIDTFFDDFFSSNYMIGTPTVLLEAMKYSIGSGGKRLRPLLALYSAEALGLKNEDIAAQILPHACALECIHNYSLIHDDLPCMDNDVIRRGQPTTHKKYGEAIALLAGDALLNIAFEIMAKYGASQEAILLVSKASGASGMIGGQILDIDQSIDRQRLIEKINKMKTGELFRAAVLLAPALTSVPPEDERYQQLNSFASSFGLAFQLVDDLDDNEVPPDKIETTKKQISLLLDSARSNLRIFGNNKKGLESILDLLMSKIPG